MQSGKILPVFRQFFSSTLKTGNSHRDANSQQGYQDPERDASEEEARKAAELLQESEEFRKNGLSVKFEWRNGRTALVVSDREGHVLRVVQSREIARLAFSLSPGAFARAGRILDRRI
jgi:hypothetical protein